MEERKQKEIEYYNKKAKEQLGTEGDFEGFNSFVLASYRFLKEKTQDLIKDKKVLDYGCGNGIHSSWLAKSAQKVIAIDLSGKSLNIARGRVTKVKFLKMDCENLDFENNSFDVVFDGGTFSSLDIEKAFSEIARVLKPDGCLIGIETFGHNPLTNLKRKINKKTGRRTEWAAEHIFKAKDLDLAKKFFKEIQIYYFHMISWLAIPFLNFPGGKILLRFLEAVDSLLKPFFKKYSFKIVFIFKNPKKV
ncbi:hypothetical protein AMJ47_00285 [Parcubacteria bacterium DG_72]|nr:MAG: hypothetical protein AMJ47_00285 [Parcubacteria bacterium DG_72]